MTGTSQRAAEIARAAGPSAPNRPFGSVSSGPTLFSSVRPAERAVPPTPPTEQSGKSEENILLGCSNEAPEAATQKSGRHRPPPPPINRLGADNGAGRTATGGGGRRGPRAPPLTEYTCLTSRLQARRTRGGTSRGARVDWALLAAAGMEEEASADPPTASSFACVSGSGRC